MTQKQKCLQHCIDYLQQRNLPQYFNNKEFDRIYRKGGAQANAFAFGLNAGDLMIRNAKPKPYDTANAG